MQILNEKVHLARENTGTWKSTESRTGDTASPNIWVIPRSHPPAAAFAQFRRDLVHYPLSARKA